MKELLTGERMLILVRLPTAVARNGLVEKRYSCLKGHASRLTLKDSRTRWGNAMGVNPVTPT